MNTTMTDSQTIAALRSKCALLEASLKKADAEARTSAMDTAKKVFGRAPADVLLPLESAQETLSWIQEIFTITAQLADKNEQGNCLRIRTLSEIGQHLADYFGNYVCCEKEEIEDAIKATEEKGCAA